MNKEHFEIKDILTLAIVVSQNTVHDVWVDWQGHVAHIQVRIVEGGWYEGCETSRCDIYMEQGNAQEVQAFVDEQCHKLVGLLLGSGSLSPLKEEAAKRLAELCQ